MRVIPKLLIDIWSHNVISKAIEMFIAFPVLGHIPSIYSLMIVWAVLKEVNEIPTFGSSSLTASFTES